MTRDRDPLEDDVIARAHLRCLQAHAGQKRDSGADYATHPHAVAGILRGRGVSDAATLAAAYLHDVLEDTPVGEEKLTAEFGAEITGLVVELTNRVPVGCPFAEKHAALIEHARRMSRRAKLIKLADRLHNMSEMTVWPAWKQQRYARAALELVDALEPLPDADLGDQVRQAALTYLSHDA